MAVFVDGWTVDAAAEVTGLDEDRALDLTEALARHSLVRLEITEDGPRSRMLETVREFVAERMAARPDAAEIESRHAHHYRTLAEQADRPLRGVGQREWAERLEAESGNLGAAVRWYLGHDTEPLPHLFRVLWAFWWLRDHLGEARPWVDGLVPAADDLAPLPRTELIWTAAVTAIEVGDDSAALAARDRLELAADGIDDPFLRALVALAMAWISPLVDDLDTALHQATAAVEQLRRQDEPFWTALAVAALGFVEATLGRDDDARRHLTEVRDLAARFDNVWLAAGGCVLGALTAAEGRLDEARALLLQGLDLGSEANSTHSVTLSLVAFARLALQVGDAEQAALVVGACGGPAAAGRPPRVAVAAAGRGRARRPDPRGLGTRPLRGRLSRRRPPQPARGRGGGPGLARHGRVGGLSAGGTVLREGAYAAALLGVASVRGAGHRRRRGR